MFYFYYSIYMQNVFIQNISYLQIHENTKYTYVDVMQIYIIFSNLSKQLIKIQTNMAELMLL